MSVANKLETTAFTILGKVPSPLRKVFSMGIASYRQKKYYNFKYPETITLYLTSRCNARCSHCFYWKEIEDSTF